MGWGQPPLFSPLVSPTFILNQPFLLHFLTQTLPNDNKTLCSKGLETRTPGFCSHLSERF